jgi:hypothetical protein
MGQEFPIMGRVTRSHLYIPDYRITETCDGEQYRIYHIVHGQHQVNIYTDDGAEFYFFNGTYEAMSAAPANIKSMATLVGTYVRDYIEELSFHAFVEQSTGVRGLYVKEEEEEATAATVE